MLDSLLRKAAVDAGFDLEPDQDGRWWRLRASGAPGVAWIRPHPLGPGAFLALSLSSQLMELELERGPFDTQLEDDPVPLPPSAAGVRSFPSPYALHVALRRLWTLRAHTPERLKARWDSEVSAALGGSTSDCAIPSATEVVAEVRRRVGQSLFREALLDYWEGRCSVTGLAVPELLRASHAKPWAVATDTERLDVHNGLLLAVHLDALFDQGLLTFADNGQGQLSSQLQPDALALLGLSTTSLSVSRVSAAHQPYLAHHRAHVFRP